MSTTFNIRRRNNSFSIMTKSRCECTRSSGSIPGVGQKFISSPHVAARNRLPSSVLFGRYGMIFPQG